MATLRCSGHAGTGMQSLHEPRRQRAFCAIAVGRAGFDDGIAVFVFADDHRVDIEVGYGLEARVPDATASRIIREVMAPRASHGRCRHGARGGDRRNPRGPSKVMPGRRPGAPSHPTPHRWRPGSWVGVVALATLILFVTHPRLFLLALWMLARGSGSPGGGAVAVVVVALAAAAHAAASAARVLKVTRPASPTCRTAQGRRPWRAPPTAGCRSGTGTAARDRAPARGG